MIISSLSLDGYGIFHNASLSIDNGMVLIQGDNEAGKSTLLGFIRTILFGFPRKNELDYYAPLAGGEHGGRICLSMANGDEFTVERKAGVHGGLVTVIDSSGAGKGKDFLNHLLGGATRNLYRNVYAFSLTELQNLKNLQDDNIKSAIYGASMGMAMSRLPKIQTKIEKRLAELFKHSGKKSVINQKLNKLIEIQEELRQAKNRINEYEQACSALKQIEENIESGRLESEEIQTQTKKIKSYIELWPEWIELLRLEKELVDLPETIKSFPESELLNFEKMLSGLDAKNDQLAEARAKLLSFKQEAENLQVDEKLLNHSEKITWLLEERRTFISAWREYPLNRQRCNALSDKIKSLLARLGNEWSEDRAFCFDKSLFRHDAIRKYEKSIKESESELRMAKEKLADKQVEFEQYEQNYKNIAGQIPSSSALALKRVFAIGATALFIAITVSVVLKNTAFAASFSGMLVFLIILFCVLQRSFKRVISHDLSIDADKRLQDAKQFLSAAKNHYIQAMEKQKNTFQAWQKWLADIKLPQGTSPETALAVFDILEQCLRLRDERENLNRISDKQKRQIDEYKQHTAELFATLGIPVPEDEASAAAIEEITRKLGNAQKAQNHLEEKRKMIESVDEEIKTLETQTANIENKKRVLLKSANAADEQDFRRRGQLFMKQRALLKNISLKENNLLKLAHETDLSALKKELKKSDYNTLETDHHQLKHKADNIKHQLEIYRQEHANIEEKIKQMQGEIKLFGSSMTEFIRSFAFAG